MINITIIWSGSDLMTIEATGHSGYAESGHDIVCAVVSALTGNILNGLKLINVDYKSNIDENIPHFSVTMSKDISSAKMKEAQIIMKSAYLGLKDAFDSFPKYIKIKEKHND